MNPNTADTIITSRLLVLQSKRLMLASVERRVGDSTVDSDRQRVNRLRQDAETAHYTYRTTVLNYGSPKSRDFWVIAYSRLIDIGNTLTNRLRRTAVDLPLDERYQVSADVEVLEDIIKAWQMSMRTSMSAAIV